MSSATINELIQMYSTGVISRESLEREMRSWGTDEPGRRDRQDRSLDGDDCIVLYPDHSGTWRARA